MTRTFWGGTVVVSILVTAAAAFYVFHQVENKEILSMIPVETTTETTPPTPAVSEEPARVEPAPQETPAPEVHAKSESKSKADNTPKRNILFSLPRPAAKSVAIAGDFNNWKAAPLTKKEKKWEISVALVPGTYHYMFVVDKKQIRDPNNKLVSDGKSLLTVKPLNPGK